MDVKNLVFRGELQLGGAWYGKIENNESGEKSLVLFHRAGERDAAQKLSDKMNGVHKGEKLATKFITGKQINLNLDNIPNRDLLQRYLQSAQQTQTTLTQAYTLIRNHIETPSGDIVVHGNISSAVGERNTKNIKKIGRAHV